MADRNVTEFGVNVGATYVVLLQDEELDQLEDHLPGRAGQFHLYFIGRRPRISISPEKFKFASTSIAGQFLVQKGATHEAHDFECPQFQGRPAVAVVSPWPHTTFRFVDGSGDLLSEGRTALIAPLLVPALAQDAAIEVLYVGQSYGEHGELSAEGRLQKHATLQKILAETSRRSPDQEVWLLLAEFDAVLFAGISGSLARVRDADPQGEGIKIADVFEKTFSTKQLIAFVEAAFIKYFQPPFNKTFRELFPDPSHTTYRDYYEADINALIVEMETECIGVQLYSQTRERKWCHKGEFGLHDPAERASMLDELFPNGRLTQV